MAHEWAHGLDNHLFNLAIRDGSFQRSKHASELQIRNFAELDAPELAAAVTQLNLAIKRSSWRTKIGKVAESSYWTSNHEMFARAFESYIADRSNEKGHFNRPRGAVAEALQASILPFQAPPACKEPRIVLPRDLSVQWVYLHAVFCPARPATPG